MSAIAILLVAALLPFAQTTKPTINLVFNPNESYFSRQSTVDIRCELLNPTQVGDVAQLWYVDVKTSQATVVSRSLLNSPTDDAPDVFKKENRNKRYRFLGKNHIEIHALQMEDSAHYACDCPDCAQLVEKKERKLEVMQLVDPVWNVESPLPLHENTDTVVKCSVEDFYPHIQHKILRDTSDITNTGRSTLTNEKGFPQKLLWEATIKPTADWHGTTLHCHVTEGNTIKQASQALEVLFDPRLLACNERQFVDSKKEQSTIECSYSGNPAPQLVWLRRSDRKPLAAEAGVSVEKRDEPHGRYKSSVTFDRTRLNTNPVQTSLNVSGENYYQQLLNNGFVVQLLLNNQERATRNITIVGDLRQIKSKVTNRSLMRSYSPILVALAFVLHLLLR